MAGFLDPFRKKIVASVWKERPDPPKVKDEDIDDTIALGVLLWVVAKSDDMILTTEVEKIKDILTVHAEVSEDRLPYVLATIEQAEKERIDLNHFTREIKGDLEYESKKYIIEILLRLASVDDDLSYDERHIIYKIATLLGVHNKDYRMLLKKQTKNNSAESD